MIVDAKDIDQREDPRPGSSWRRTYHTLEHNWPQCVICGRLEEDGLGFIDMLGQEQDGVKSSYFPLARHMNVVISFFFHGVITFIASLTLLIPL
jgi:hypothetical protein